MTFEKLICIHSVYFFKVFDIRIELQTPVNGTEAYNGGIVNPIFKLEIGGKGQPLQEISAFYQIDAAPVEAYSYSYFEDLFARDNNSATLVNVLSQTYRHITLYAFFLSSSYHISKTNLCYYTSFNPGLYTVLFTYNNGSTTSAEWEVRDLVDAPTTKNVILFIGDGMTSSMATAARLLGHKSVNGKYKSKLFLDSVRFFNQALQKNRAILTFLIFNRPKVSECK